MRSDLHHELYSPNLAMSSHDKAHHHIWLQIYNKRLEVQHVPLTTLPEGILSTCVVCGDKYNDITPSELRIAEARRDGLRRKGENTGRPTPVPVCLSECGHHLCLGCAVEHFHRLVEDDRNEKDETLLTCPVCRTVVEKKNKWKTLLKSGVVVVRR
ncbi:Zinc finger RING-type protein [Macrophomina phaseolina MS6]|uniref:Zinc finger RING-type protein n=1 Tax=Macrophomina phaseolina (strain MS6) TaxID=1126212 RepID=K2RSU8_MACPH|nr:Zinc finger RING-type protein [Macrophomina phaseolina MS6]